MKLMENDFPPDTVQDDQRQGWFVSCIKTHQFHTTLQHSKWLPAALVAVRIKTINTCKHAQTHTHANWHIGACCSALDCKPSLRQSPQPSTGLSNCGPGMHPSVENMETVLPHYTARPLSTDGTTEQECDLWFSISHGTSFPMKSTRGFFWPPKADKWAHDCLHGKDWFNTI